MSRRQAPRLALASLAKDLARQAHDCGGLQDSALAVFRRFLDHDRALLDCLPCDSVAPEGRLWELLLCELDAGRRRSRGMFFTPRPLVEFVMRGVQDLLPRLDRPAALHLVDPACGYGGFLLQATSTIGAARFTGLELDEPTCEVARMLARGNDCASAARILEVNPLLAGESLRETILGPPGKPLVPIIVGNPPWSNFGRLNRGEWIDGLLKDYRAGLAERKSNLADDAIKFIRWAQYWIDEAGAGILAFVTPNTWLTGLTHRQMRQSLLQSFDEVSVLDLHGETGDSGDENVFGVRSGVAVLLALKNRAASSGGSRTVACRVSHASLRGSREEKQIALAEQANASIAWRPLHAAPPDWLLVASNAPPASRSRSTAARAYAAFWPLDRIFRRYTSGVQTKNDAVFVGFTRKQVAVQVRAWLKEQPQSPAFDAAHIRPYMLAPFDRRFVYYDPRVIGRARLAVMRHMGEPNLGLVFMRQSTNAGEYDHFLAVDCLVSDRVFYSRHGAPFLAPLWLDKAPTSGRRAREANFTDEFLTGLGEAIGKPPEPHGVFHYLYAVAYSPRYRKRFAAELARGFPRIPLPASRDRYERLAKLGKQLVELHVAGNCGSNPGAGLLPAGNGDDAGEGFRLGGYDVLERWARPRRASGLSARDQCELNRLAWIGHQTRRLMEEIDHRSPDRWSG